MKLEGDKFKASESADARKYAADQIALYTPNKTEAAAINSESKRQERIIAGRASVMARPEWSTWTPNQQADALAQMEMDSATQTFMPGAPAKEEVSHIFSKDEPATLGTPGRVVAKAPAGMTLVGTSGGKPVYQDTKGNRHIGA